MKLDIFGDSKQGFSAHGESNGDVLLKQCPFCGSEEIKVSNTHTPSYSGSCQDCGAEGPSNAYPKREATTKETLKRQHEKAYSEAVKLWNTRAKTR